MYFYIISMSKDLKMIKIAWNLSKLEMKTKNVENLRVFQGRKTHFWNIGAGKNNYWICFLYTCVMVHKSWIQRTLILYCFPPFYPWALEQGLMRRLDLSDKDLGVLFPGFEKQFRLSPCLLFFLPISQILQEVLEEQETRGNDQTNFK